MIGTKLIQALISFNKEEWISFRKYLLMYISEDSDNYEVFSFLQKRKAKLEALREIEMIRVKHFPHLSQKSILNILSRLYLWLEDWMVYYTMQKDKLESDLLLVKQLNRRGLYNLADQKSKQLLKQISNGKGLSIAKSKIESELYYYQFYSDNPIKNNPHDDLFPKLVKSLKKYHLQKEKLIEAEIYNRQIIQNKDYSDLLDQENPSDLSQSLLTLSSALKKYDVNAFKEIKEELYSDKFVIGSDVHIIITYYLLNLVSRLYNIKSEIKSSDISEMYSYAIESGVLLSNGKIPTTRFNNLISTIAQTSTIEETSRFISTWIYFVDTNNTEAYKDLSEARNQYFHQRYKDISKYILVHTYSNPEDKILALGFTLISLFEDDKIDYDIVFDFSINMKRTLKRNERKLSKTFLKSGLNFIRIIDLLNVTLKKKVDINIDDYHPVLFKNWLLHKLK